MNEGGCSGRDFKIIGLLQPEDMNANGGEIECGITGISEDGGAAGGFIARER